MAGLFSSPQVNLQNPPERIPGLTGLGAELVKRYMQTLAGQRQAIPYRGYQSMMDPRLMGPSNVSYWNPYGPGPSILQPGQPSPDAGVPPYTSTPPITTERAESIVDRSQPNKNVGEMGGIEQTGSLFGPSSSIVKLIENLFPGYIDRAFPEKVQDVKAEVPARETWSEEREGSFPEKVSGQTSASENDIASVSGDSIVNEILKQLDNPGYEGYTF